MSNNAITTSIGGKLSSEADESAAEWKFVYSPSNETVSLDITPTKMIESRVTTEFSKMEIEQLINWLQAMQNKLPE